MARTDSNSEPDEYPVKLSRILESVLEGKGWNTRVREYRVFDIWDEVVGVHTAKNTSPRSIDRGVLFVTTRTSSWSQELTMMKDRIIERLNKRFGEELISDIRFVQGKLPEKHHKPAIETPSKEVKVDSKKLKKYTRNISDEGLKEIIERLLTKALSHSDDK